MRIMPYRAKNRSGEHEWEKMDRIRTSETGVVLDPVVDIDVGQIEDARFVVSTEYTGDLVGDIPTER